MWQQKRLTYALLGVCVIATLVLPFVLNDFWTKTVTGWIPLAVATLGLNLLTGYNGQISVGHGALYGVGAYTCAFSVTNAGLPFLVAIVLAAVVSFAVGVVVGLPALRIKGLYLALVTLAVAMLFPQIIDQFKDTTGGSTGFGLTNTVTNRRGIDIERSVEFVAPSFTNLNDAQWRFYFFMAIAALCFLMVRNLVASRVGRSMIAIRDNEIAAEANGVNVSVIKVLSFGVSSALAGVGGALFALWATFVSSGSFVVLLSLYFMVAMVIGGPSTIAGPAVGAVFYGFFLNVVTEELPEASKAATPLILGIILIVLMLVAPGGIAGSAKMFFAKKMARQAPPDVSIT